MSRPAKILPFISPAEIENLNRQLATAIFRDYEAKVSEKSPLLIVVTLKGALFFAADLTRHLTLPTEIDFVRVASYGSGTKTSGIIKMTKDLDCVLEGRHVLVLDEIVDSGRTLNYLLEHFQKTHPASLKVCALLSKPSRREVEIKIDYLGREVEDKFVVGYGLDFGEKYRNLPGIHILAQD